jgi:hypothetical protein
MARADGNVGAGVEERLRGRETDSARPAGDENRTAFESVIDPAHFSLNEGETSVASWHLRIPGCAGSTTEIH